MIKKLISSLLLSTVFSLFVFSDTPAFARAPVSITAPSAVLYDTMSGRLVYSKTPHGKRAPASTTKVLTAMVVMDRLPLNKVVTIPSFVTSIEPTKIYLKPGEKYYVRDLLRAILIKSANDAAEVLAYAVAGSRSKFSTYMNKKARSIGAKRSNFIRPSGLPAKGQRSTAYDLALIMKHAEKYPFIMKTLKEKTRVIRSLGGKKVTLRNHNKMLWRDRREIIGKTGWTRRAKHCFVGHIKVHKRKVLVAVMGSHSLWRDLKKLIDYQFGVSYYRIKQNRKIWSTHDIRKIQLALKKAGYSPGPRDGKFGPKTLSAVEKFQRAKGLTVDGVVGTKTWKKLKAYL